MYPVCCKKACETVDRDLLFNRLKQLGINGIFLKHIEVIYENTKYISNLNKGYLDALDNNLRLEQGCPLRPVLFNPNIDDISSWL